MAELHVITTLAAKRKEIESYMADLERDLDQARADLVAVMASLRLFAVEGRASSLTCTSLAIPHNSGCLH